MSSVSVSNDLRPAHVSSSSHSVQSVNRFDLMIAEGAETAKAAAISSLGQLFKPGLLSVITDAGGILVVETGSEAVESRKVKPVEFTGRHDPADDIFDRGFAVGKQYHLCFHKHQPALSG